MVGNESGLNGSDRLSLNRGGLSSVDSGRLSDRNLLLLDDRCGLLNDRARLLSDRSSLLLDDGGRLLLHYGNSLSNDGGSLLKGSCRILREMSRGSVVVQRKRCSGADSTVNRMFVSTRLNSMR